MKKFLMSFVLLATLLGESTDLFGMDYASGIFGWPTTTKTYDISNRSDMQSPMRPSEGASASPNFSSESFPEPSSGKDSPVSHCSDGSKDSGVVLEQILPVDFVVNKETLVELETFAHWTLFVSSKILLDHGTDFIGGTYTHYPKYSFLYEDNSSYNSFFLQMLKDIELLYAVKQINLAIVFAQAFEVMHFLSCISYCTLDEKTMTVMTNLVDAYDRERRVISNTSLVTQSNLDLIFSVTRTCIEKLAENVKFLEIKNQRLNQKFNESLDSEDFTEFKLLKSMIQTLRRKIEQQKTETFDLNVIKQTIAYIRDVKSGDNSSALQHEEISHDSSSVSDDASNEASWSEDEDAVEDAVEEENSRKRLQAFFQALVAKNRAAVVDDLACISDDAGNEASWSEDAESDDNASVATFKSCVSRHSTGDVNSPALSFTSCVSTLNDEA